MKKLNKFLRRIKKAIVWILCFPLPINTKKIVVNSFYGSGYGDNPKYVVEKLLNKGLKIIWLVKTKDDAEALPDGIIPCINAPYKAIYHLCTSRVWIDNCRKGFTIKKKRQFYIQMWHGGGAQKRCELDVIDKLGINYKKLAIHDAKNTDLMISESRFMTNLYHHSFWYDGPVYECGYPRYDILLKSDENITSKVYNYFNIEKTKKLVLYAPTFRVDHSFKAYNIDFNRLCNNLKRRFGNDYVVLVHLHPNIAHIHNGITYDEKRIINSTFYPDTQELIAASSILIGDYSSINYDFSLRRLPVFRYVADLKEYRNDRDLYFSFGEYPYPYAQTNDELESLILNFDNEKYIKNLNAFFEKLGAVIKPDSSNKIAHLIMDFLNSKNKNEYFKKNKDKFIY